MVMNPAQFESGKACVTCLGDGVVITRFNVGDGSIHCARCGDEVGTLTFDSDLVTENW